MSRRPWRRDRRSSRDDREPTLELTRSDGGRYRGRATGVPPLGPAGPVDDDPARRRGGFPDLVGDRYRRTWPWTTVALWTVIGALVGAITVLLFLPEAARDPRAQDAELAALEAALVDREAALAAREQALAEREAAVQEEAGADGGGFSLPEMGLPEMDLPDLDLPANEAEARGLLQRFVDRLQQLLGLE